MPEKTLREKVERAKFDLVGIEMNYPHISLANIDEALTALEDRVAELEEKLLKTERKHHENSGGF